MNLIVANLAFTAAMFGVIWIIQLVHYPMLEGLDETSFVKWHAFHSRQITYIVGPLMVGELVLASWLLWVRADLFAASILACTLGVWLSTFLLSVPIHESLGRHSERTFTDSKMLILKLVKTNWVRTLLYTLKIAIFFAYISFA